MMTSPALSAHRLQRREAAADEGSLERLVAPEEGREERLRGDTLRGRLRRRRGGRGDDVVHAPAWRGLRGGPRAVRAAAARHGAGQVFCGL